MKRTLATLALLSALALSLTGCAGSGQNVDIITHFRGTALPQKTASSSDFRPTVYWTGENRVTVGLTAYGSSSCPQYPTRMTVDSSTHVTLSLKDYSGACTSDLGAYTSEFALPGSVSRTKKVTVSLVPSGSSGQTNNDLVLAPSPTASSNTRFQARVH